MDLEEILRAMKVKEIFKHEELKQLIKVNRKGGQDYKKGYCENNKRVAFIL